MSDKMWKTRPLGEVTFEAKERLGNDSATLPVYGVDRHEGLTSEAKYSAANLAKYKLIRPGMFAYNPMRLNIGSIGFCSSSHQPGLVSPDYVVFGCRPDELFPAFLKHAIAGRQWTQWTTNAGVGSVRQRIYYRELARLPITIPPYKCQREIAQVLGTLDDKIELNRRMNETLEAMARSLFQNWFVDRIQAGSPKRSGKAKVEELATLGRRTINPGEFPEEISIITAYRRLMTVVRQSASAAMPSRATSSFCPLDVC